MASGPAARPNWGRWMPRRIAASSRADRGRAGVPACSVGERRYPTGEALLAEAMAATGLEDVGPGDFREGLDVLLDSLEHDAELSPTTDDDVIGALRRRLVNRLEVEAWYARHPEIEQLPVRGPVDINGLPRSGTTAL